MGNESSVNPKSAELLQAQDLLQQTSDPLYKIPIFLSYARPYNDLQTLFLGHVIDETKSHFLFPRTLGSSDQYAETPITSISRLMLASYGCLAIAFRRAFVTNAVSRPGSAQQEVFDNFYLSSPYIQIESAMAYQQGLPVMVLVEDGVNMNSIFGGISEQGAAPFNIIKFNLKNYQSITDFFNGSFWRETFVDWSSKVRTNYTAQVK
jgi:hypothetical protein